MTAAPRAREGVGKDSEREPLALNGVTRRFGDFTAVDNVSVEVAPGELLALVGASGSGKTTTLRVAAGYEIPDSGTVTLGGKDITRVAPERRGFGMVFQHYALFPHMPVEQNVAFGLEARGVNKVDRLIKARAALASDLYPVMARCLPPALVTDAVEAIASLLKGPLKQPLANPNGGLSSAHFWRPSRVAPVESPASESTR